MEHQIDGEKVQKEVLQFTEIKKGDLSFNHVVKAGKTLYLTSQLSCDLKTGKIVKGTIEEQTKNALENVKYLLEKSNSGLNKVLKVIIYMRNINDFHKMEYVYRKYFYREEAPARVTVQALSPIENIDIEIEVIAVTN